MNKLKLQLDDLRVDSFDTTAAEEEQGTVFGEQCTCPTNCTCPGCPTCDTCAQTCAWTCDDDTCGYTCQYYQTCNNTCNYVWTCQQVTECGASGYPNNCPW